jgi:hypothetical protein
VQFCCFGSPPNKIVHFFNFAGFSFIDSTGIRSKCGSDKGSYYAQHEKNCKKNLQKKVYKCDFCPKEFNFKSYRDRHKNVFNGHNEFDFEIILGLNITLHLCSLNFPAISTKIHILGLGQFPDYLCLPFCTLFFGGHPKQQN